MGLNAYVKRLAQTEDVQPLIGLATLMSMAYKAVDLAPLGERLLALAGDDDAEALMDLSTLLQLRGDGDTGVAIQRQGLSYKTNFRLEPESMKSNIRLLAIMTPGNLITNTPIEFLAEGAGITLEMLYVAPDLPFPKELPEHDIAIIAVCELDRNRPVLGQINSVISNWPKPVLNKPNLIARMSRDLACQNLHSIPGVVMPSTVRINGVMLERLGTGEEPVSRFLRDEDFPIIVRPIDSHAGKGLNRLDCPGDVLAYMKTRTELNYFISRFVDYSDSNNQFKKYRVMLMQGKPFVAHMAVSEHWMVHYLNAGITESRDKRAIEEDAMLTFDNGFAKRHAKALAIINERVGVDYFGIDCAETADGQLMIFEIGSSMVVHAMDPEDVFPYKKPQMQKVFEGFEKMLADKIADAPEAPNLKVHTNTAKNTAKNTVKNKAKNTDGVMNQ